MSNHQYLLRHSRYRTARSVNYSWAEVTGSKSITLGVTFPLACYLAAGNDALSPFYLVWW